METRTEFDYGNMQKQYAIALLEMLIKKQMIGSQNGHGCQTIAPIT